MQCERYVVRDGVKSDRTVFVLTLSEDAAVRYRKLTGPEWFLPSGSVLRPVWTSADQLRVVATWLAPDYGKKSERWSPVYVLDTGMCQ
jgi:hypothetical protein